MEPAQKIDGHDAHAGHAAHGRPGMHHSFADAEKWAKRFEDPGRDAWQRPDEVLRLIDLSPDARLADIGSATGYFPVRFARAAPRGMVYGIDIEPGMVNYLNLRAAREGLNHLRSLLGEPDDPCIPEPVDIIFVCDTYHHIDARPEYFRRLKEDLLPGGQVVIVDYKKEETPVGPPVKHRFAPGEVIDEMRDAGYALVRQEELPYQYVLVFAPGAG